MVRPKTVLFVLACSGVVEWLLGSACSNDGAFGESASPLVVGVNALDQSFKTSEGVVSLRTSRGVKASKRVVRNLKLGT